MTNSYRGFVLLVVGALATPCFAQAGQAPPEATATRKADPNDKICQKIEVTGSRLGYKRVCMTRAEWADQQLQDRQATEKIQVATPGGQ